MCLPCLQGIYLPVFPWDGIFEFLLLKKKSLSTIPYRLYKLLLTDPASIKQQIEGITGQLSIYSNIPIGL